MSTVLTNTLAQTRMRLRPLSGRDMPQVLQLVQRQTQQAAAMDEGLVAALGAGEMVGRIATVGKQVVGFVLCTVTRRSGPAPGRAARWLRLFFPRLRARRSRQPVQVHWLEVVVDADWPREEVERALLADLDGELRGQAPCVQVVVPETDLQAQLFLRDAGYRATEVLRGYYGAEDGYRMVWLRA
jgi:ribosomal protein S18 acetylase RimI-like enzyme